MEICDYTHFWSEKPVFFKNLFIDILFILLTHCLIYCYHSDLIQAKVRKY